LLVELGLMKIARLGQKKKDDVGSDEEYLLPELTPNTVPTATTPQQPITPPVQPRPTATEQPVAPKVETPKVEAPKAAPTTAPAQTPAQPKTATPRRISPLGASLTSLLATQQAPHDERPTEEAADNTQVYYDPQCAEKIEAARNEVLNWIREQRPRFAPTFEQMTLTQSTIGISVPSRELHDEILRNKTLLLTGIAREAKVNGSIELEVTINEQIRAVRPIKLEDRVKFFSEKNPILNELRQQLDMEVE
jgi:DNA polymerase-3 subunit gamma/tau